MKRAIVTGGSGDIGAAICRELASTGHFVFVHAHRGVEKAAALTRSIAAAGGSAEMVAFDVTDRIRLYWELSPGLEAAAARHERFLREEVLAEEVVPRAAGGDSSEEWTVDGERARVGIERVHKGG